MKKTFTLFSLCFMSMSSLQGLAQSDSLKTTSLSITSAADTIKIGNMIIIKNQNEQSNYDKKIGKTHGTIAFGNVVIVKPNDEHYTGKRTKPYGTIINITDGRLKKDTFLSVNDDTVKIGRYNIIKAQELGNKKDWESMIDDGDFDNTHITIERKPKRLKNVSTKWLEFDLGFVNWIDKTPQMAYIAIPNTQMLIDPYPSATNTNLKLNNTKASNVNVWIVQQKTSLYKHYLNLKYGVGIEMYNFRFEQPISFGNTPSNYVYLDNVHFKKNKLFVEYLTIPIQLNLQSNPGNDKSFYASLGMSASYLLQSHTKQISDERGKKKVDGNFNLNNYKMAAIGELGIGGIRLYGSYSMTNLFDKNLTYFDMAPFVIGLRISNF